MEVDYSRIEAGMRKYVWLMQNLMETDVSSDLEFQRAFNGFYRMRQRPKEFYRVFFLFLEQNKHRTDLTYEEVLNYLYQQTGCIHASFSSKLLATVRTDMPIWDQFVLKNLGLRAPYSYEKDRLRKTVQLYQRICDWYQTSEAAEKLELFQQAFPETAISDVKKIDFILWGSRKNKDR